MIPILGVCGECLTIVAGFGDLAELCPTCGCDALCECSGCLIDAMHAIERGSWIPGVDGYTGTEEQPAVVVIQGGV